MGGKSSKAPAPVAPTQVDTPSVDVAQVAAEKALAAQGDVRASQSADQNQRPQMLGDVNRPPRPPRPARDPASVANTAAPAGNMAQSAILTG